MNGSGGSAFSGSLLQNDSPSVIVNECWESEDLYLFSLHVLLSLSRSLSPPQWRGSAVFSLPTLPSLSHCQAFFLSPSVLGAGSSHVTASPELPEWGMGAREGTGRKGGREGRRREGRVNR